MEIELTPSLHQELSANINFEDRNPDLELANLLVRTFIASDIPIRLETPSVEMDIDGRSWRSDPADRLLEKLNLLTDDAPIPVDVFAKAIAPIRNSAGEIIGRACVLPELYRYNGRHHRNLRRFNRGWIDNPIGPGSIVCGGTHICGAGVLAGLIVGIPVRAARVAAKPICTKDQIAEWASEQALLLKEILHNDDQEISVAKYIAGCGGDVGELKVCQIGDKYFALSELESLLEGLNEIWVVQDATIYLELTDNPDFKRSSLVISVDVGVPSLLQPRSGTYEERLKGSSLEGLVLNVISREFEIDSTVMSEYRRVEGGYSKYRSRAPALIDPSGAPKFLRGRLYSRGMSLAEIQNMIRQST